jgi:PAS domain S-box-containing protein
VFASGQILITEETTEVAGRSITTSTRKIPVLLDGEVLGVVTAMTDLTEQRRAERSLRESEEKYRSLLELSPDPVVILQDGVYKLVNRAFTEVFGYTREDVDAGFSFFQLVQEKDEPAVRRRYEDRLAGKELPKTFLIDLIARDGHLVPCETSATRIQYESKPADLVVIRDISERRRAEDALRESEEKFRTLAEESPNMIFINKMGQLAYVNPMCCEVMGYGREEFYSPDFDYMVLIAPEYREEQADRFRRHESGEEVPPFEYAILTKDGRRLQVTISTRLIDYEGGRAVLGIVTDVTYRKRAEEQLLSYQRELQQLTVELSSAEEEERRRLASELHDQVGQTLAAAKMKLGALCKLAQCDEGRELTAELSELLDRTIADTRSLTFQLSPPLLHEMGLVAAAEWLAEQVAERHGLTVVVSAENPALQVRGDLAGLVFRSLRELLMNVVKHADAGDVTVSIRASGVELGVSVEDDGCGFEPPPEAGRGPRSGGFGLFSIRERLGHLGGRLEIDSAPGKGSRVHMFVPVSSGPSAGAERVTQ